MTEDVRWQQRLANYRRALASLSDAVELSRQRPLSDLEQQGLISDGDQWMDMIANRNRTSHTYNKATAVLICEAVIEHYHPLFIELANHLEVLRDVDRS